MTVEGVTGNRYQGFRGYPDGSVAYPSGRMSNGKVKIVRALPGAP